MQNLTISLSENTLKVSLVENKEFKGVSAEVSKDTVDDQRILDNDKFAEALRELVPAVTSKSLRSLSVSVIIEPNDVLFKFVSVNKTAGEAEDQIINEIKSKVKDFSLEEMYFSYQKIAPFVYQFVGIRKAVLDAYMDVLNKAGLSLRCVIPWTILLPKFTDSNEPTIYISKLAGKQIVVLSEFNAIFYSGVYEKDKSTAELQKIVQELSIYKRSKPINKVFIYNYDNFSLNPDYQVLKLEIPNSDLEEAKGYEMHLLLDHMIQKDKNLLYTQTNLLNLLPVPVARKEKSTALVYVGTVLTFIMVASLLVGAFWFNRHKDSPSPSEENIPPQDQVLSQEVATDGLAAQPSEVKPQLNLKKEDLSLRIENGAGVPGIAGRAQTFLEGFGYKVVSVGNAESVGNDKTVIKIKPEKSAYQELLKEDMKTDFTVEVEESLKAEDLYDALIIVGTDAKL